MPAAQKRKFRRLPIAGVVICLLVMISVWIDTVIDARSWRVVQTSPAEPSDSMPVAKTSDELLPDSSQAEAVSDAAQMIPVHLVGAVSQPGIYQISAGTYLYELLDLAGGMTESAAAEQINLALRLDVNQQIYIPTREEAMDHPALLPSSPDNDPGRVPLLELNTATAAEFEQLPGVGPVTARAIISYRDDHGGFACSEDLMLVPGIKESRYGALQDFIYVRPRENQAESSS